MKALDFYNNFIKGNVSTTLSSENLIAKKGIPTNLVTLLVRKFTNQRQRLFSLNLQHLSKIYYFAKQLGVDYLEYILSHNPEIPYVFFPKSDHEEINYFLKIMLKSATTDGFDEKDFDGRWQKFEIVRKNVGKNIHYDLLKNTYELYGFKSVVYPDSGNFPDNYKLTIFNRKKTGTCFDIGAYIGDSTFLINKYLQPRLIYAFEPSHHNYEVLTENLKLNNMEKVVKPVEFGVGMENSYVSMENKGAASKIVSGKGLFGGETVRIVTIDDFVKENKIKDTSFIKMDIEGQEKNALMGASNTIVNNKPDLMIAIYHRGEHFFEIPKFLKKLVPEYHFRFLSFSGSSPIIERFIAASIRKI
jgi:FkbM family methyltransferase